MSLKLFKWQSWTIFFLRFLIWIDALYIAPAILGYSFFYYSISYENLPEILCQKLLSNLVLFFLIGKMRFEEVRRNDSLSLSIRASNLLLFVILLISFSGFSGLGLLSGESYGSADFGQKSPLSEYAILLLAAVRLFGNLKPRTYYGVGLIILVLNVLMASRVGIAMLLILFSFDLDTLARKSLRYFLVPGFLVMEALGAVREGIAISAKSLFRGFLGDAVSTQSQVLNGSVILSNYSFADFGNFEDWLVLPFRFLFPGSLFPLSFSPVDNIIRLKPWAGGGDYFVQLMYFSDFLVIAFFIMMYALRKSRLFLVGFSLGFVRFLYYDVFAPTRFVFLLFLVWCILELFRPLSAKNV